MPRHSRSTSAPLGAVLATGGLILLSAPLRPATTGQTALSPAQGAGAATSQGDYVTSDGALDANYQLWIEVPPGLSRLVVEVFDPDIGRGGGGDATANRDRARGSYDTQADYRLYDPGGTQRAFFNNCDTNTCSDNAWQTLLNTTTNLVAGHWLLEVEMNSAETDGDDVNAFGVRAHDGNSGAGGTELPVYWDSYATYGTNNENGASFSRSYTFHPWVTAGCRLDTNDFDFDSSGSMSHTSRSGAFVGASGSPSGNDVWRNGVLGPWTTDSDATDYGVWTQNVTITGFPGNGNYGQIYLGNELASNPPPSSQPEANTYRIYLPTDAGAAPAKPYVEQMVRWDRGPNPPQTGQTSTFTVTVRLVNPTARAITFSTPDLRLVATYVPGGGVVYGGNPQTSQGGMVLQPAVGGTGLVVWNPGSLAAGSVAIMGYEVDVTPTSNGQRLPVTATPASGNGTRAYWYDETGNTTQGRASYLFGPLCELAVTEGLLTHALLDGFRAYDDRGRQVVEWSTAGEAGTAGFLLERLDPASGAWSRVHEGVLAAAEPQPAGAVYRLVDETASPGLPATYRLTELEVRGERRRLGRFAVDARQAAGPELVADGLQVIPRRAAAEPVAALAPDDEKKRTLPGSAAALELAVRTSGLHFVSTAAIAAGAAASPAQIEGLLERGDLRVLRGRQRIASWPASDLSGIFFYGEAVDSLYSRDAHYHLAPGKARRPRRARSRPAATADGVAFGELARYEQDRFAGTVLPLAPESDYWFWEGMLGGHPTVGRKTFTLDTPGAEAGSAAELTVRLQGANDDPATPDHRVRVLLGGHDLGTLEWDGLGAVAAPLAVPGGILGGPALDLELIAETPAGVGFSALYVDGFELAYRRRFTAQDDRLLLRGDGATTVEVGGFSSPDLVVLELADATRPGLVEGWELVPEPGGGYAVRLAPRDAATPYWVGTAAAALAPAAVRAEPAMPRLARRRLDADLLVLAPTDLLAGAERLADLRRSEGMAVSVIDTAAVYHAYGDGTATPQAIQAFLAAAWQQGSPRPRFALLVGDGSLDFRNLLGHGESLVPTRMATTASGLFAADALLGDVAGDDGVPEIVVGRLPVRDAAELEATVDKLAVLAAAGPASPAVFVADDVDGGADFAADGQRVAAALGEGFPRTVLELDALGATTLRGELFAALDAGAATVAYLGHGAADRLATQGLLTTADAAGLDNPRPFLLTAMTCTAARFEVPGFESLGEALVERAGGGAGAVWSMSSLIDHQAGEQLAAAFYAALAAEPEARLGDLLRDAQQRFLAAGGDPAVLATAVLLGDPASRPGLATVAPGPPSTGVGE